MMAGTSMNPLPSPVRERLAKLVPMLASDKDGEVLATAAAIRRTLATAGADLHDLVAMFNPTVAPPAAPIWKEPETVREACRIVADWLNRLIDRARDAAEA